MSPKNKKKLEAAIDNLFVSPQARSNGGAAKEPPAAEESPENSTLPEGKEPQPLVEQPVSSLVSAASEPANPVTAAPARLQAGQPGEAVAINAEAQPPAHAAQNRPPEPPAPAPLVNTASAVSGLDSKDGLQMVVFALNGQYYGIAIDVVESIIKLQAITRLPHVPHYNIGLTNLRGKVLPVFSLRRRFGLPDQEASKNTRIIVIRLERGEAGLLVDEVSEVGTILRENIEPAPAVATSDANRYIKGVARMEDRLVILPDLDRVIESAG